MQSEESTGLSNLEFTAMRLTERTLEADKFRVGMASRAWRSRCYANGRRTDVIFSASGIDILQPPFRTFSPDGFLVVISYGETVFLCLSVA